MWGNAHPSSVIMAPSEHSLVRVFSLLGLPKGEIVSVPNVGNTFVCDRNCFWCFNVILFSVHVWISAENPPLLLRLSYAYGGLHFFGGCCLLLVACCPLSSTRLFVLISLPFQVFPSPFPATGGGGNFLKTNCKIHRNIFRV